MKNEESSPVQLETGARTVLTVQIVLVCTLAWVFYALYGQAYAQAAMYGGCIVMFNVWITNRRVQIAAEVARVTPGKEVSILYIAALQRFIFTLGFFILGMGLLKLPPIPMLIAFAIAQLGYLFNRSPK